jgi:hypothetical protein
MKRHIQDWLKVDALTAPPVSFFLEQIYLKLYTFEGNFLREVFTWRVEAGLARISRPAISGRREVFHGLLWRRRRHCQIMFGASRMYCKIARPT